MGHTGIPGQLVHDLIHHRLQRRFQISVLLFAGQFFQLPGQVLHELLHAGVLQCAGLHLADQLLHDLSGPLGEIIPPLGLLPIKLRQLVAENLFRQTGLDLGDALLGQVASWYHPYRQELSPQQEVLLRKLMVNLEGEDLTVMESILTKFARHTG